MKGYTIAIHGGAGTLLKQHMTAEKETAYKQALSIALDQGTAIPENGGTAVDALAAAVRSMEDSALFNAGKGSVFTAQGTHEINAAIMDGKDLNTGAVSLITSIKNSLRSDKNNPYRKD
ncbi:isoaspartyl peptidase/L-asparaginase [Nonlabens agnitus]|uniref:Beta-aspartyl-peptidase n=1 Tax=Nonlabens agnitus TaxID=870484 RepID=A0A2S9WQ93_9FLAO|nr:isoaspartyl peptidase/L-asparaginase [Nonlabens agnitus]PRP65650.1 hypothetical protein BST86_00375 [Nonlabens agnitus]